MKGEKSYGLERGRMGQKNCRTPFFWLNRNQTQTPSDSKSGTIHSFVTICSPWIPVQKSPTFYRVYPFGLNYLEEREEKKTFGNHLHFLLVEQLLIRLANLNHAARLALNKCAVYRRQTTLLCNLWCRNRGYLVTKFG